MNEQYETNIRNTSSHLMFIPKFTFTIYITKPKLLNAIENLLNKQIVKSGLVHILIYRMHHH